MDSSNDDEKEKLKNKDLAKAPQKVSLISKHNNTKFVTFTMSENNQGVFLSISRYKPYQKNRATLKVQVCSREN